MGEAVESPQSFQLSPESLLCHPAQELLTYLGTLSSLHVQQGRDMQPILRPSIHTVTKEVRGESGRQVVGLRTLSGSAGSGA